MWFFKMKRLKKEKKKSLRNRNPAHLLPVEDSSRTEGRPQPGSYEARGTCFHSRHLTLVCLP